MVFALMELVLKMSVAVFIFATNLTITLVCKANFDHLPQDYTLDKAMRYPALVKSVIALWKGTLSCCTFSSSPSELRWGLS